MSTMEAGSLLRGRSQFKKELYEALDNEDTDGVKTLLRSFSHLDILNERLTPFCEITALHLAVGLNSVAICKLLLKYGSNPNSLNCVDRVSPLHLSILYDYEDIVKLLIRAGGNPLVLDGDKNSCYDIIYKNHHLNYLLPHLQVAGAVPDKEALVISPVPFRSLSTPSPRKTTMDVNAPDRARKSPSQEGILSDSINTITTTTDESYVTCPGGPSPLTPQLPSSAFIERIRTRLFFDDDVQPGQRRTSSRIAQIPIQDSEFPQYLMTEDETSSSAGSILTTTTVSSYSASTTTTSSPESDNFVLENTVTSGISDVTIPETVKRAIAKSPTKDKRVTPIQNRAGTRVGPFRTPPKAPSPSPSIKEIARELKFPLTPTTTSVFQNYFDDKENRRLQQEKLSPTKDGVGFSPELSLALTNFELLHNWGNHRIQFLQFLNSTPTQRAGKSYYNYLLLDPKIIRRSNFSGNYLKSDIISNGEKFQQFLRAIFYIGKGCGNRPLQHLVDAKAKLMNRKKLSESEKTDRILQIWKSGQGIIVHSVFHHSLEREANVNEAAMLDAIGIRKPQQELTNVKKGSYAGTPAAQWSQKVKNQLGSFLLYKCFCSFVVVASDAKMFFPHDV